MSSPDELFLGIDIGSTNLKVHLVDADGRSLAVKSGVTPWERGPDGSTIRPHALLDMLLAQIEKVCEARSGHVSAVGITGFGETGVPVARDGSVLAPGLPWYDTHGADALERLSHELGADAFTGIAGLPLNLKATVLKFDWLSKTYSPRTSWAHWLSVQEWVAMELTGEITADPSLASRTGLLDVITGEQSPEISEWAGVSLGLLPEMVTAGTPIGQAVRGPDVIRGAWVTVAGMDHLAAAVGLDALGEEDLVDSCGTGEAIIRHLPRRDWTRDDLTRGVACELSVGRDVFPDRLVGMATLRSGIGSWRFLKLMGIDPAAIDALDEAALAVSPRPDGPKVTNVWLEHAQLHNIGYEPDKAELWRAALEAVQERAAHLAGQLDGFAGTPSQRRIMTGGGLRSRAVREIKRRHLGEYEMPDVEEATSLGAAQFARMAAGVILPIEIRGEGADVSSRDVKIPPAHAEL